MMFHTTTTGGQVQEQWYQGSEHLISDLRQSTVTDCQQTVQVLVAKEGQHAQIYAKMLNLPEVVETYIDLLQTELDQLEHIDNEDYVFIVQYKDHDYGTKVQPCISDLIHCEMWCCCCSSKIKVNAKKDEVIQRRNRLLIRNAKRHLDKQDDPTSRHAKNKMAQRTSKRRHESSAPASSSSKQRTNQPSGHYDDVNAKQSSSSSLTSSRSVLASLSPGTGMVPILITPLTRSVVFSNFDILCMNFDRGAFSAVPNDLDHYKCNNCGRTDLSLKGNFLKNARTHLFIGPCRFSMYKFTTKTSAPYVISPPIDQRCLCHGLHVPLINGLPTEVLFRQYCSSKKYVTKRNGDQQKKFVIQPDTLFRRIVTETNDNETTEREIVVRGSARHGLCNHTCTDCYGRPSKTGTCMHCESLLHDKDFLNVLERSLAPVHPKTRRDALLPEGKDWIDRLKSKQIYRLQGRLAWSRHNHLRTRERSRQIVSNLGGTCESGDVQQLILDAQYLARNGTSDAKRKHVGILSGLLHSVVMKEQGKKNGIRHSKETKELFACIHLMGGAVTAALLDDNVGGPSESTNRRTIKQAVADIRVGGKKEDFKHNMLIHYDMYKKRIEMLGLPAGEFILASFPSDESGITINPTVQGGLLFGLCHHVDNNEKEYIDKCCTYMDYLPSYISDGVQDLEKLKKIVFSSHFASYVRIVMLNPLHKALPSVAIGLMFTCNKFDHDTHVLPQWMAMEEAFDEVFGKFMMRTGHDSDGDARRFVLQFTSMKAYLRRRTEANYRLNTPCMTYAGRCVFKVKDVDSNNQQILRAMREGDTDTSKWVEVGVTDLHSQDPLHCVKLLHQTLDGVRCIPLGDYVATHNDLVELVRATTDGTIDQWMHDLTHEDVQLDLGSGVQQSDSGHHHSVTRECALNSDRQNIDVVVKAAALNTCHALKKLGHLGSALMYSMHRRYLLVFFGVKISMQERVRNAAYVAHFMRLQRLSVKHSKKLNFTQHSWTYQCYLHVQLSCFSSILLMRAYRDFCPSQDYCGEKFGSDGVEAFFRMLDGYGALESNQRNCDARQAYRMTKKKTLLQSVSGEEKGGHGVFFRTRQKQEVRAPLLENQDKIDKSKKVKMSDEEFISEIERGNEEASRDLAAVGIKSVSGGGQIPDAHYNAPWLNEKDDLKQMRVAENRNDGIVVNLSGGVEVYTALMK